MVGFTALNQSNETLALEILERHNRILRPFFSKYNGREVKTIGDSFLVEFDSALDATICAIEIQTFLHDFNISARDDWKIKLRIGVHVGDIVQKDKDIFGDAVNIASRIQPLADPEGVCISEQVYDQIHNKINCPLNHLESAELKNVKFQTNVYAVVLPWEGSRKRVDDKRVTTSELDRLRVAVLPFSNMSPDPNDEYFADGMTEELISTMSNISGLKVIARTSVMAFKNKEKKIDEISRELCVGTILEGSVRKSGEKLRITAQLIDSKTSEHLWSESFNRDLKDVFAIQNEISETVANALRVTLLVENKALIEKKPIKNIEAYTLFLRGMHLARNSWKQDDTKKAIEYFERVIKLDPEYVEAYCWLSNCYVGLSPTLSALVNPREAIPKAEKAVESALKLNPNLPDVHLALAWLLRAKLDWKGAERETRKALELNSNVAGGHATLAWILISMGRYDEALVEANKALELDPISSETNDVVATAYYCLKDYDRAIEYMEKMREFGADPHFVSSRLGWAYLAKSDFHRAAEEWEKAGTDIGIAYPMIGRAEETRKILNEIKEESKREFVHAWGLVEYHLALGEKEEAIQVLQKAYADQTYDAFTFGILKLCHLCDDMVTDPRIVSILKKMGLEQ